MNSRTLGELLDGLVDATVLGASRDEAVSGVFDDSRTVQPRGVFVALRGAQTDGGRFAEDAIRRGARVVVMEEAGCSAARAEAMPGALAIRVPDARAFLAQLAARWYSLDAGKTDFRLAGVTGTNGKSTTAFMTQAIVRADGRMCGLLGTVQYDLCSRLVSAGMTTPGPLELAGYLRECREHGAGAAVMEVSSHALAQKRTDALRFAAAAFTNLSGDHLDYHGTMEAYGAAKARLFAGLDADAVAVINRDDPAHEAMLRECKARVAYYSLSGEADISSRITRESVAGTHFVMRVEGRELALENAVAGRHNVYNAMAAAGLARGLGASVEAIAAGLGALRNIPGRLQRVPCTRGRDVFVDYAHTDDALANVLSALRPLTRRRLIVVFGCGGDRDRTKRPRMGKVAAELADAVIVTSDNPRTEDPRGIIREIIAGIPAGAMRRVMVEPDRRCAIHGALSAAGEGDVVLIAGKGHEDYQIVGTVKHHFDDVEVALAALAGTGR